MDVHPLRAWRENNGWTLARLSTHLGVVPSHLSQIERHPDKEPSLSLASKLSELTGIPISKFVKAESTQ